MLARARVAPCRRRRRPRYGLEPPECHAAVNRAYARPPILPAVARLLQAEQLPLLAVGVGLVGQACESRGGRRALVSLPASHGALLALGELLHHDDHQVRAAAPHAADATPESPDPPQAVRPEPEPVHPPPP